MRLSKEICYIKDKVCLCLVVILLNFIFRIFYNTKNFDTTIMQLCNFDFIITTNLWGGLLDFRSIIFPIGLLFVVLILYIIHLQYDNNVVLKYENKDIFWAVQCKKIIILSFIYTIMTVLIAYATSSVFVGHMHNNWIEKSGSIYNNIQNINLWNKISFILPTYNLLGIILISMFVGLSSLGIFVAYLKIFLKSEYVFSIVILLFATEMMWKNISLFCKRSSITLQNIVQPISIIFNILYMIIGGCILYNLGKEKINKVDFL